LSAWTDSSIAGQKKQKRIGEDSLPVKGGNVSQIEYMRAWRKAHPNYHKYWMRMARKGERIMKLQSSRFLLGARVDFAYFEPLKFVPKWQAEAEFLVLTDEKPLTQK
jgi:hypothetical protein